MMLNCSIARSEMRYRTAEHKIHFHTTSQLCNMLKTKQ
jgi:hypothetical protein